MFQASTTAAPSGRAMPGMAQAGTCFFPDQFNGRAALASLLALAQAQGLSAPGVNALAAQLGMRLPTQVGVHDVMRAADALGLAVELERLRPQDLLGVALPALLLCPDATPSAWVLVLAHCDARYVVTHDHASAVPVNSMGPLHMLAQQWAPRGEGWCVRLKPR